MPRANVDTNRVIELAAELVDEIGVDELTLKEISGRLGISPPSLYNHIQSLSELKLKISHYAMELLRDNLVRATIGKNGIDALKEMGLAYIKFAREHTGLYETIQWMNIAEDVTSGSHFSEVVQLVYDIAADFGASELEASHIIRIVRSLAHGFASVDSHNGFSHPSSVESSYLYALDIISLGIKTRQQNAINMEINT